MDKIIDRNDHTIYWIVSILSFLTLRKVDRLEEWRKEMKQAEMEVKDPRKL